MVLEEAGYRDKKLNLSMLIKYAVKNEHEVVDKRMTQSVVLRILQKRKGDKKSQSIMDVKDSEEMEMFLENDWQHKM